MIYAVGKPGQTARYIGADSTLAAHKQAATGEVCVQATAKATSARISPSGQTVIVVSA